MKLRLLCIGRTGEAWLRQGMEEYAGRIRRYLSLTITEIREADGGKKGDPRYIREKEGALLLEKIPAGAAVIVLDERGEALTSEGVAGLLDRHMLQGTPEVVMIIGGAYGLSDAVRQRADRIISLSALTLTHLMARLLLLEQIYRGLTILRNEPYHNR